MVPDVSGGSQTVLECLKNKHPARKPASPVSILIQANEPPDIHPVVFDSIDATTIRSAAKHTRGAAGPSGTAMPRAGGGSVPPLSLLPYSYATLWPYWPNGFALF